VCALQRIDESQEEMHHQHAFPFIVITWPSFTVHTQSESDLNFLSPSSKQKLAQDESIGIDRKTHFAMRFYKNKHKAHLGHHQQQKRFVLQSLGWINTWPANS